MLEILIIWTQFSEICSSLKFGFLKISSFLVEIMTRSSEGTSTSGMEGVHSLMTFAPKSSYGEIFFISPLELVHEVLTPKMKKKWVSPTLFQKKRRWKNALISIKRS